MTEETPKELEVRIIAKKHWEFLEGWMHKIYVDSFIHGFKHGVESKNEL